MSFGLGYREPPGQPKVSHSPATTQPAAAALIAFGIPELPGIAALDLAMGKLIAVSCVASMQHLSCHVKPSTECSAVSGTFGVDRIEVPRSVRESGEEQA
jgi:hypothetical protein